MEPEVITLSKEAIKLMNNICRDLLQQLNDKVDENPLLKQLPGGKFHFMLNTLMLSIAAIVEVKMPPETWEEAVKQIGITMLTNIKKSKDK